MKEFLLILIETLRLEWRMLRSRPTPPIVQPTPCDARGVRTHTTSRCAWN